MKSERWQHIDALLGEALELEDARRSEFLENACAGDPDLRRDIDALLEAHAQSENFIEAPALVLTAQALAEKARSMAGRQLGHYKILSLIGAGGMGAVWKANDTQLGRDVAIKTLPEKFDRQGEWVERFEREAKALASLNNPSIAAIYGVGEHRGTRFLVLELVEGETLAERLNRGPIPLEESLRIAEQISIALEAAHEKGIIHCDLKPANIKVTPEGVVKVLDFGLAEILVDDASNHASNERAERPGTLLGTVAYMAPEQARGGRVDKRVDIWAFGVVLYEMVTGERAFDGAGSSGTLADNASEPNFDRVPLRLRRLLRKCLEKNPKHRLRDIADAWALVEEASTDEMADAQASGPRLLWIRFALGIAVVTFLAVWLKPAPSPEVVRFRISAPPGSRLPLGTPAISDDGRTLAFVVEDPDGVSRIHLRTIDGVDSRPLSGTEDAFHPLWSPHGRSLAFTARNLVTRIDLAGGAVHPLIATNAVWQGDWSRNDDLLVRGAEGLVRISVHGGTPTGLPNSLDMRFPVFLQDGKRFLVRVDNEKGGSIQLGSIDSTERTIVVANVLSAPILASAPNGKTYLLFMQRSDLMAQEFDETTGKVRGNAAVLASGIAHVGNPAVRPAIGVSPAGVLAYQNAVDDDDVGNPAWMKWLDRSGKLIRTFSAEASVLSPRLSPDRSRVAGVRRSGGGDIWVMDLRQGTSERKTFGSSTESFPIWSKDNSRLAYHTSSGIFALDIGAGPKPRLLTEVAGIPTSWWGERILYTFPSAPNGKVYLLDVSGKNKVLPVGSADGNSAGGEFSPDGRYVAFDSDSSGRPEIYIQQVPPGAREVRVSTHGGKLPRWNGDGTEIFFISPQSELMAVDVQLGEMVRAGTPHALFSLGPIQNRDAYTARAGYDVTADGQRFLVVSDPKTVDAPITVVLNWWVDLEKQLRR